MSGRRSLAACLVVLTLVMSSCASSDPSSDDGRGMPATPGDDTTTATASTVVTEPTGGFTLPSPNPASALVTLDETASVSAAIGPEGGTIEASGSDGRSYRLTVPPDALGVEIELSMTPIAGLTSEAVDSFAAGVHMAPDGLVLARPATLHIGGGNIPQDAAVFRYEGTGDNLTFERPGSSDGLASILVSHFSGAGAANPSPDAGDHPPSGPYPGMHAAIVAAYADNDSTCVGDDVPVGEMLESWYLAMFETTVLPGLEAATTDDLVLSDAIGAWLLWKAVLAHWEALLCPDLFEALETVGDPEPVRNVAARLISTGIENGIDTAGKVCAADHDLGETRHMVDWGAAGSVLSRVNEDISPTRHGDWPALAVERAIDCLTFEVMFESYIEVEETNSLRFTAFMHAVVPGVVPSFAEEVTTAAESDWHGAALTYSPTLDIELGDESCRVVITNIMVSPLNVQVPDLPVDDPRREVRIWAGGAAGGRGEQKSEDEPPLVLKLRKLSGSEYFDVTCTDLLGGPNEDGAWGPWTFNGLHEDEMPTFEEGEIDQYFIIPLKKGSGSLYGQALYSREVVKSPSVITERTTINLRHTG